MCHFVQRYPVGRWTSADIAAVISPRKLASNAIMRMHLSMWTLPNMPSKQGPSLLVGSSRFGHAHNACAETVASHALNHCLQLLLPRLERNDDPYHQQIHAGIQSFTSNYTVIDCNLSALLSSEFLQHTIRQPAVHFQAVSLPSKLASPDSVSITPDATCYIRLSSQSYEQLGLPGKKLSQELGTPRTIQSADIQLLPPLTFFAWRYLTQLSACRSHLLGVYYS